jgi:hypothetical protein
MTDDRPALAVKYRNKARDALTRANVAEDNATRELHLYTARQWHALAVQIEEGIAVESLLQHTMETRPANSNHAPLPTTGEFED